MPVVRVVALLVVGLPSFAALMVGFPLLGFFALRGPPLETSDWVGGVIFWGLATVGAVVSARAALRVWRGGASLLPGLTLVSPVLLVVGLAAGVWAAFSIQEAHVERHESGARSVWCERPEFVGRTNQNDCERAALDCLHLAWDGAAPESGAAEKLAAALTVRRQQAERAASTRAKSDGFYSAADVRALDRLRDELRFDARNPEASRARQAGLVCLATPGS